MQLATFLPPGLAARVHLFLQSRLLQRIENSLTNDVVSATRSLGGPSGGPAKDKPG